VGLFFDSFLEGFLIFLEIWFLFRRIVKEIKENLFFLPGVVYPLYIKCSKRSLQAYIEGSTS